jgi:hypothetical protein
LIQILIVNLIVELNEACNNCNNNNEDNNSYPHWPCGNLIFKYITKPKDWLQSGWAFDCYESKKKFDSIAQVNSKQCLGTIKCNKCEAQTRPQIKGHGKNIEQQLLKGCSIKTCDGMLSFKFSHNH